MSTALYAKAYRNITDIKGPLVFLRSVQGVRYGERITLINSLGQRKSGQVLEVSEHAIVVQVFEGSDGLDKKDTAVFFSGDVVKIGLSEAMLGRVFDGSGNPRDGLGPILPEVERPITGSPINPVCRQQPSQYIETGISTIDLMNTLVKGQKLPIFTGAGLPANRVAVQIARQVIRQSQGELIVVFAGIGITSREYSYFYKEFQDSGAIANSVLFLNLADDPTIERILTPRLALTTAEYFAFDKGRDVLVILTDMLNYANALREISSAREEIPGRRGYPGYLYTDLATNYERAGIIKGQQGSVTQLPIVTMPNDDITHPVIDLTGYITEGQLILSRELDRKGIYPPINPLPSLSRLMNLGSARARRGKTIARCKISSMPSTPRAKSLRSSRRSLGWQAWERASARSCASPSASRGNSSTKGSAPRSLHESLELAWDLLGEVPRDALRRIEEHFIQKYMRVRVHTPAEGTRVVESA
jgi:V/A-type H+-transporting ATPase subunit B